MTSQQKKELRTQIQERLHPDSVTFKKDGSIVCKWGFFYRHGVETSMKVAKVKAAFPHAHVIESYPETSEHWNAWPKNSWRQVTFRVEPVEETMTSDDTAVTKLFNIQLGESK